MRKGPGRGGGSGWELGVRVSEEGAGAVVGGPGSDCSGGRQGKGGGGVGGRG